MNTEHLFAVYLAKRRMDAERRRQSESPVIKWSEADREAASRRAFEAIRASVEDSQRRRRP